jgi:uncharacterized protein (DUF2267 family)
LEAKKLSNEEDAVLVVLDCQVVDEGVNSEMAIDERPDAEEVAKEVAEKITENGINKIQRALPKEITEVVAEKVRRELPKKIIELIEEKIRMWHFGNVAVKITVARRRIRIEYK